MESLLASHPWNLDPYTVPIPWRKELAAPPANRKLRLGVVFDDGVVKPQPPVARAMRETVDALRAAGHEGKFHIHHRTNAVFLVQKFQLTISSH